MNRGAHHYEPTRTESAKLRPDAPQRRKPPPNAAASRTTTMVLVEEVAADLSAATVTPTPLHTPSTQANAMETATAATARRDGTPAAPTFRPYVKRKAPYPRTADSSRIARFRDTTGFDVRRWLLTWRQAERTKAAHHTEQDKLEASNTA